MDHVPKPKSGGEVKWCLINCLLGRGFFMLKIDGPTTIKKVLMFTSFMSNWGMCIFQGWILGFNPDSPKGMEIPTWVILCKFLIEFCNVGWGITFGLGTMLGFDKESIHAIEQCYCVALKNNEGWRS